MIRYYFKIAIANLKQSKVYSIISILSLTIGMATSILLMIYVSDELSFDRYHDHADNIYRLCQEENPYHAPLTAKILADQLPVIKKHTRILPLNNVIVEFKDKRFIENATAFVDPGFFNIFSFTFKNGNNEPALEHPFTLVISEKIAHKYFGQENPVGKILKIHNKIEYTITGVFKNMPGNSHFTYDFFITLSDADIVFGEELMTNGIWQSFLVYFELQDEFSQAELELMISDLLQNPNDPNQPLKKYTLQSLKDIHLYSSHIKNDIQPQNSITYILIFSAIGLLVLLIACFNYINLLSASITSRVIEIGVRKTYGASRKQLVKQFLFESILVLFVSTVLAIAAVEAILPIFNYFSGKELSFLSVVNRKNIFGILAMMLTVVLIAGWYPAFILSSARPTKLMKTLKYSGDHRMHFKKILIGTQFTIAITLITCSIIMMRQTNFLQHTDLGFDKESVLISKFDFGNEEKYNSLKQALLNESLVSSVSAASRVPSERLTNMGDVIPEGQTEPSAIQYVYIQPDYFKVLGIQAAKGRLFSSELETDSNESIVLNAAAVKYLDIKGNPIGQILKSNWPESSRKIIGVINDVHFESLYEIIKPTAFVIHFEQCHQLLVKTVPANPGKSINTIARTCLKVYPDELVDFEFLDSKLEQLYQKDKKTFQLMGFFAIISILLACMGLLGMTSFVLTRRTKEIGIRKVNGASIFEIMQLLNLTFIKWIIISFTIATPIAYYGMKWWLESFAYKIVLNWEPFALSGLISTAIAMSTVSLLTYLTASRNPTKSLRYE